MVLARRRTPCSSQLGSCRALHLTRKGNLFAQRCRHSRHKCTLYCSGTPTGCSFGWSSFSGCSAGWHPRRELWNPAPSHHTRCVVVGGPNLNWERVQIHHAACVVVDSRSLGSWERPQCGSRQLSDPHAIRSVWGDIDLGQPRSTGSSAWLDVSQTGESQTGARAGLSPKNGPLQRCLEL